jgi:hypothetical protein
MNGKGSNAAAERAVQSNPAGHADRENNEEAPAPAESRKKIGSPLAQAAAVVRACLEVFRYQLAPGEALRDLPVEIAQFAALGPKQLLDIGGAIAVDFSAGDERVRAELGVIRTDALGDLSIDEVKRN